MSNFWKEFWRSGGQQWRTLELRGQPLPINEPDNAPSIPPAPISETPDTHIPNRADVYEFRGKHWFVCSVSSNECYLGEVGSPDRAPMVVPVGYVQKYMKRVWPEDP